MRTATEESKALPPEIDDIIEIGKKIESGWKSEDGTHLFGDFPTVFNAAVDAYWRSKATCSLTPKEKPRPFGADKSIR